MTPTPTLELCKTFASRCLSEGLAYGLGTAAPGKMCIEALWCNVLGLPHSDDPPCVAPGVRRYKIMLNDLHYGSSHVRAQCLVRLGVAQMGSNVLSPPDQFIVRVKERIIREVMAPLLYHFGARMGIYSPQLVKIATYCKECGTDQQLSAAYNVLYSRPEYDYAVRNRMLGALYAWQYSGVTDSSACLDGVANSLGYGLQVKQHLANIGEQVLRELGSPGIAWLDQLEAEGLVPPMTEVDLNKEPA